MTRCTILSTLLAISVIAGSAQGFQGVAPFGTAVADYDPATGRISVSVNNVINWFILSDSFGLTGDEPLGLPAVGGLFSNDDEIIGETRLPPQFSYTDLDLGNVAQINLFPGDLTISWNTDLGFPLSSAPVSYDFLPLVPEPTTLTLAAFSLFGLCCRRRNRA